MEIPVDIQGLVVLFIALLPGLVFAATKRYFVGIRESDYSAGTRILDAVFVTAAMAALYVLIGSFVFGWEKIARGFADPKLIAIWADKHPVWGAVFLVGGLLVVPFLWAFTASCLHFSHRKPYVEYKRIASNPQPRAWETASDTEMQKSSYVRVKTPDGQWYGGWYGGGSAMGRYPFGRDLYIERQWVMSEHGDFLEERERTAGLWLSINDETVVEWFKD